VSPFAAGASRLSRRGETLIALHWPATGDLYRLNRFRPDCRSTEMISASEVPTGLERARKTAELFCQALTCLFSRRSLGARRDLGEQVEKMSQHFQRGKLVAQMLPVSSPRLNAILSLATEICMTPPGPIFAMDRRLP
jgi:hypothetical protein